MAARVTEILDAVVAYLQANWTGTVPTISREYMASFVADEFTGPRVYVMSPQYGQVGVATRANDEDSYTVFVVFVEKYTLGAETIPNAWLDERVEIVEQEIYELLGDHRTEAIAGLWPETATVNTVYDIDFLHQTRLFVSEVEIEFREIA